MNYSALLGILMASIGILKEIITALAMGVFVIVLTIRNERINRKLALILLVVFYAVPTIMWFITPHEFKDKTQSQEFGLGYISIMVITLLLQIVIGYLIAELIFKKRILQGNRKASVQQVNEGDGE
jgi:hypothetical protein